MRWSDDRGGINFVKLFMLAAVVAGAYFAWIYVPPWLDHWKIKRAVRLGCNQAYASRFEATVKKAIYNGFAEAKIQNEKLALDGSTIRRPLHVDDQNIEVTLTEKPQPECRVKVYYERDIVWPYLKKQKTLVFRYSHTEDLSEITY